MGIMKDDLCGFCEQGKRKCLTEFLEMSVSKEFKESFQSYS